MANRVTKHVTIQLQHALENVFLVVDVLLDMFSMMAIVLNQKDVLPMSNLKRKRILSSVLTGEIKLYSTHFCLFRKFDRLLTKYFHQFCWLTANFEIKSYDSVIVKTNYFWDLFTLNSTRGVGESLFSILTFRYR